ncbi:hypothetical protein I316_03379 [Kwoniella heveanensis BCC8398]|uniref:Uncharacterized protein n=1 Tax=Kwoniella heveanensis BCC8398 TaxID=1296120 RepID=A0A1B9GUW9_9TREE|nr:hypothetical protein I316_03379 [Kwoniella heveanensis BCC8398]
MTVSDPPPTRAIPMAIDGKLASTAADDEGSSPPPTLSHTYQRSTLLSLATPPSSSSLAGRNPSASTSALPRRLSSFAPILRCSVALSESEWGVSEDNSSLLDGQPISKDLPIPADDVKHPADRDIDREWSRASGRSGNGSDSELLFHYSSFTDSVGKPVPAPLPVLIDFQNPFNVVAGGGANGDGQTSKDNDNDNARPRHGSFTDSPMPVDSATENKGANPYVDAEVRGDARPIPSRAQTVAVSARQPDLLHPRPKSHLEAAAAAAGLPIRLGTGPLSRKSSLSNPNPDNSNTTIAGVKKGASPSPSPAPAPAFAGQAFPASVNSSTTSLSSMRMGPRLSQSHPHSQSHSHADIRASLLATLSGGAGGAGVGAVLSRSNSNSSLDSDRSSFSFVGISSAGRQAVDGKLNPFAPPFPLPSTTSPETKNDRDSATSSPEDSCREAQAQASLPLPRPTASLAPTMTTTNSGTGNGTTTPGGGSGPTSIPLPSSLPARPGPLPPVFVKRESAALPQPMALKDVAPLGKDWEGEHTISGNERRRRASQVSVNSTAGGGGNSLGLPAGFGSSLPLCPSGLGGGNLSRRVSLASDSGGLAIGSGRNSPALSRAGSVSGGTGNRPERLVKLGQGLRSHSPQPQSRRGSTSIKP